ncbi:secreted protein [Luteibacter rhizovicinus]|uniref:Secreted protein n=1 Tax=Luteibacter rhizovicinus TaxID=242606 RepID=A0A4R3Z1J2_9GAMM|nr:twin-arginine translocation signal domain-containing protein [Luteibacter rhizovicinus]TCV97653.1 secreted protein [Luteibacter rhizovicinus]
MDRRRFLQGLTVTGAGLGLGGLTYTPVAPALAAARSTATMSALPPVRVPVADLPLRDYVPVTRFTSDDVDWHVVEDLRHADGVLILHNGNLACVFDKRTEPAYAEEGVPYLGMKLADIALAEADLLADRLLRHGEPDEQEVRGAAPPPASQLNPENYYGRLPWTTFVGTKQCADTMPVYTSGSTRGYHSDQVFADLHDPKRVARRREGVLGGWLPAVHKVVPIDEGRWYDVLVFADVDAHDRFVVQTWHRTALVEHGRISKVRYGYSYPACPPRREAPDAAAFYRALLRFHDYWQRELADASVATVPAPGWSEMARFAFARELVVRPGGDYPKYGAVDRDYYGNEYDGFQDTFTSSLYANLEWGRYAQAAAVLDEFFDDFIQPDGMINMRGAEIGQFGLTLSLMARYLRYTGDDALLRKHRGKIEATAQILLELHDESLALPRDHPGHGLIHGWNESDACLFPEPMLWWKPYYANSALAVRGLTDLAGVWPDLGATDAHTTAMQWQERAGTLRGQVERSLRANIRHDLTPPYVGPLPGAKLTFRESLTQEKPSEQQWPHRAYAELLQADILPDDLAHLVIDCMRGHGATSMGVVANVAPPSADGRDILGFISYGYAQQLLRLNRIDEYLLFLYAHRYHAHTPGSWTAGEVTDLSGGMPLFCIPAQMTIPLLVRWMLVFEDSAGQTLHLGRAIPRTWLESRKPIGIDKAPTRWGYTGFQLRATADGDIEGTVTLPQHAMPDAVWLSLRMPVGKRLSDIHLDGQPVPDTDRRGETVRLRGKPGQRIEIGGR